MTAEAFPQLKKESPKTLTEKAIVPKILIADPDKNWQEWYTSKLKEIANIVTVGNCSDASKILEGQGFNAYTKDPTNFNAYIIDPLIPPFKWPNVSEFGYRWGLELIRSLAFNLAQKGAKLSDLLYVISADHQALKETKKLYSSTFPIQHIYTKNPLEKAEGYPTKERFLEDIITKLGKGRETDSDIF